MSSTKRVLRLGCVITALGLIGFVASIPLALMAAFANMYDGFAFSPIAWSPDGKQLAFGVVVDGFNSWTVFTTDNNAKNVTQVVNLRDDQFQDDSLEAIAWNETGTGVQFLISGPTERYFEANLNQPEIREISQEAFASQDPDTAVIDLSQSGCSDRHIIHDYDVHPSGLVAQSVCHGREYGWTIPWHECSQELEICDISTGKVLAVLNEYPLETEEEIALERYSTIALRLTTALFLIGLITVIGACLHLLIRRFRQPSPDA